MLDKRTQATVESFLCGACAGRVPFGAQNEAPRCPACGRTYDWQDGILVLGSEAAAADYPEAVYELLYAVEPRHFWFRARNRAVLAALREAIGELRGRSVLEVGCGTGYVLQGLEAAGMRGCGLDMHMEGLRYARRRTGSLLVCESAARVPFEGQFDAVSLCDVIEHDDDDVALLRSAAAALRPGGAVLVTVPAQPSLWTRVDEAWGHKRRYTRASLRIAMRSAGLKVVLLRHFFVLLYPLHALQRRLIREEDGADRTLVLTRQALRPPPPPLNQMLALLAAADSVFGRFPLPFGTSLIAVARRAS